MSAWQGEDVCIAREMKCILAELLSISLFRVYNIHMSLVCICVCTCIIQPEKIAADVKALNIRCHKNGVPTICIEGLLLAGSLLAGVFALKHPHYLCLCQCRPMKALQTRSTTARSAPVTLWGGGWNHDSHSRHFAVPILAAPKEDQRAVAQLGLDMFGHYDF